MLAALLALMPAAAVGAVPDDPWLLTRNIPIVSRDRSSADQVTAELYRPREGDRLPVAVIINSSGGISPQTELYYARVLAQNGMAALVIDSFAPRGVRRTGDDQNRVPQSRSNRGRSATRTTRSLKASMLASVCGVLCEAIARLRCER